MVYKFVDYHFDIKMDRRTECVVWARPIASFGNFGLISDPLMVSRFHDDIEQCILGNPGVTHSVLTAFIIDECSGTEWVTPAVERNGSRLGYRGSLMNAVERNGSRLGYRGC